MKPLLANVFTPYSDFAFVVAGVAFGTLLLFSLAGQRLSATTSATLALVALVGVLVVPSIWRGAAELRNGRAGLLSPSANVGMAKCLHVVSGQVELARAARRHIGTRDSFALDGLPIDRPCFQLNLLPRRLVSPADEPGWTLRPAPSGDELPREARMLTESVALIRNR